MMIEATPLWSSEQQSQIRSAALKKAFLTELQPHKKTLSEKREQLQITIDAVKARLPLFP